MNTTCNRCGKTILVEEAEVCWYCNASLCTQCWSRYSHCGHPEADAINEFAASASPEERASLMMKLREYNK